MKAIFSALVLALSLNTYAESGCSLEILNQDFGPTAILRVSNPEVVQEIQKIFPYSDCYNGMCTYTFDREDKAVTFYFSKERGNGHWARGQAAEYTTFWTDNGMWLSISSSTKSYSRLFKDGCGN